MRCDDIHKVHLLSTQSDGAGLVRSMHECTVGFQKEKGSFFSAIDQN